METVFEAAGGVDGMLRLAQAWHHRRAIDCFDEALVDAGPVGDGRLRGVLHDYFA